MSDLIAERMREKVRLKYRQSGLVKVEYKSCDLDFQQISKVPLAPKGFRELAEEGFLGIVFLRSINALCSLIAETTEVLHSGGSTAPTFNARCVELELGLGVLREVSAWGAEAYLEDCCSDVALQ